VVEKEAEEERKEEEGEEGKEGKEREWEVLGGRVRTLRRRSRRSEGSIWRASCGVR
jgi:hypothetical protein